MIQLNIDLIADLTASSDVRPLLAEQVERTLELARHLPPPDRELLRAFIQRGVEPEELGVLLGRQGQAVRDRINKLLRRLADPAWDAAVRFRERLSDPEWRLIQDWLFAGRSLRSLARARRSSLHRVRKEAASLAAKLARLQAGRRELHNAASRMANGE